MIGILGGVFDPIHNGHLAMANNVLNLLPDSDIRFVPCKTQVLKGTAHTSDTHRLAMLDLALADLPQCKVDQRELVRDTPSYMTETLSDFRKEFPETPLSLIMGVDAFLTLPQWHQWQTLLNVAHMIVLNRPGFELPTTDILADLLQQHRCEAAADLGTQVSGYIYCHTMPEQPVASREIRMRLQAGESIEDLVPAVVFNYIKTRGIYI